MLPLGLLARGRPSCRWRYTRRRRMHAEATIALAESRLISCLRRRDDAHGGSRFHDFAGHF